MQRRPPDELAKAVAMGERPVAMKGEAAFFNGQVIATVTISRGIGRGFAQAGKNKKIPVLTGNSSEVSLPGFAGGGNGILGAGPQAISGGSGGGGGLNGPPSSIMPETGGTTAANIHTEVPDISGMEQDEALAYLKAKVAIGSPLPPVTLHLKLHNLGSDKVSVEIDDFDSDLGNFAVQPGSITIAAQQVNEPEPMISQLGVTSDEMPVKVTLKYGGKKETQTVLVKSILAKPAEPPH